MSLAVNGDGPLFHSLQKRGLGLRGSTVDLIRKKQIALDRTFPVFKFVCLTVVHRKTGDIGRQSVRGELDSLEIQRQSPRKGQCQRRFPDAGAVLKENVTAGVDRGQHAGDHVILSHKGFFNFLNDESGLFQYHMFKFPPVKR